MAFVQVPPDSTGNKVETTTDGTTMRQVINIGQDAAGGTAIAPVDATLGLAVDTVELAAQQLDYDTGGGSAPTVVLGIALPASGGPVAGGTATNPIRIDTTGTTAQPVSQATASNLNAQVVGELANDAVDSGNPIKIGGKAVSAAPTAVAANDRVNGIFDLWGRQHVRSGNQAPAASTWTGVHVPAAATQATKTQASAGSGKRNICTGFTATLCANGTAPVPTTPVTVKIIDGASGGGTVLWQTNITMPAAAGGIVSFNRSGLWLVGSQATAMTIEFSGAGPTNTYESVAFDGVVVEE